MGVQLSPVSGPARLDPLNGFAAYNGPVKLLNKDYYAVRLRGALPRAAARAVGRWDVWPHGVGAQSPPPQICSSTLGVRQLVVVSAVKRASTRPAARASSLARSQSLAFSSIGFFCVAAAIVLGTFIWGLVAFARTCCRCCRKGDTAVDPVRHAAPPVGRPAALRPSGPPRGPLTHMRARWLPRAQWAGQRAPGSKVVLKLLLFVFSARRRPPSRPPPTSAFEHPWGC